MTEDTIQFLSVIIPTHQRESRLFQLVNSVISQKYPAKQLELIVVSNFYSRRIDKFLSFLRMENVKYISANHLGANYARNIGANMAKGDIFVFIDDDCLIDDPYYLAKVNEYHLASPETSAIGGRYVRADWAGLIDWAYQLQSHSWLSRMKISADEALDLLGGNVSYKKWVFHQMNFEETITIGGAETEFHFRLLKSGLKLKICEDLPLVHDPRLSFSRFCRKAFLQGRAYHGFEKEGLIPRFNYYNKFSFDSAKRTVGHREVLFKLFSFVYTFFFKLGYIKTGYATDHPHEAIFSRVFLGYALEKKFFWLLRSILSGLSDEFWLIFWYNCFKQQK